MTVTVSLGENNVPAGTPRAFRVPYSRDLADRIARDFAKQLLHPGRAGERPLR